MTEPESADRPRYECDRCGACCKGHLIVECEDVDVLREPRLIDADRHHRGKTVERMLDDYGRGMVVIIAISGSCPFLADDQCSIYPTRPNCCVGLQAGDDQCQEAREAEGLPPLLPISAVPPDGGAQQPPTPPSDVRPD